MSLETTTPRTPGSAARKKPAPIDPALWRRRSAGDQNARAALVEHFRYLVALTRQRVVPGVPPRIDPEDLEQAGLIALLKAVDKFEPVRGVKFESFAISCVRGAMLEHLRSEDWAPRSVRTLQKRLAAAEHALALRFGREPTDAELASELGTDVDGLAEIRASATVLMPVSIEETTGDSEYEDLGPLVLADQVRAPGPGPDEEAASRLFAETLAQAIGWLPEPERHVVEEYYFEDRTMKRIARGLQRSESRIHQLSAQARLRLRGFLEPVTDALSATAGEWGEEVEHPELEGIDRPLPLTRRAWAAWARWREATTEGREAIRRQCDLHEDEAKALLRLQHNLAGLGDPAAWQTGWAQGAKMLWREGLEKALLEGLDLRIGPASFAGGIRRLSDVQRGDLAARLEEHMAPSAPKPKAPASAVNARIEDSLAARGCTGKVPWFQVLAAEASVAAECGVSRNRVQDVRFRMARSAGDPPQAPPPQARGRKETAEEFLASWRSAAGLESAPLPRPEEPARPAARPYTQPREVTQVVAAAEISRNGHAAPPQALENAEPQHAADRIRAEVERRGLDLARCIAASTQREIADRCGTTPGNVSVTLAGMRKALGIVVEKPLRSAAAPGAESAPASGEQKAPAPAKAAKAGPRTKQILETILRRGRHLSDDLTDLYEDLGREFGVDARLIRSSIGYMRHESGVKSPVVGAERAIRANRAMAARSAERRAAMGGLTPAQHRTWTRINEMVAAGELDLRAQVEDTALATAVGCGRTMAQLMLARVRREAGIVVQGGGQKRRQAGTAETATAPVPAPLVAPKAAAGLRIAGDLVLPLEAATATFGILGQRGMGKTATAVVLAEELLRAGQQVVILDPVGVWWGLRAGVNALPAAILGGEHGDLAAGWENGEGVAEAAVETGRSMIIDLSHLRKAAQVAFVADFAEALYHAKARRKEPLHLILDEADCWAPQRSINGRQRALNAVDDLVRRGRARGIGVTLISQRSAVLSKDVLSQIETLICLRTLAPQDRGALEEWINAHDVEAQREEFMGSLASLAVGEAWVWSPGFLGLFRRARIRRRDTWDSSATPKPGQALQVPSLCPVDTSSLMERLQPIEPDAQPASLLASDGAASPRAAALRPLVAAAMEPTGILFKDAKAEIARQTGATVHAVECVAAGLRDELRTGSPGPAAGEEVADALGVVPAGAGMALPAAVGGGEGLLAGAPGPGEAVSLSEWAGFLRLAADLAALAGAAQLPEDARRAALRLAAGGVG